MIDRAFQVGMFKRAALLDSILDPSPTGGAGLAQLSPPDTLRQHHVDALVAVDHLRDAQVGGEAAQRVGLLARKMVRRQISLIMSRSAITTQSSRSGSNAIVIMCVGVSASGHSSVMSSRRCSSNVPISPVSIAVTQTSPSPCAPWPSPTENSAPSMVDREVEGRALHQFLVVEIAAIAARRQRRDHAPARRRRDRHHAEERRERQLETPRQRAGVLPLSSGMWIRVGVSKSSGSAPASGRIML